MQLRLDGEPDWVIDGIPVDYDQTDIEDGTGPAHLPEAWVDASYIQWPDGSGVSLQLHRPTVGRSGLGGAYSTYRELQNLLHDVVGGVDLVEVVDYARARVQEGAEQ